MIGNAEAGVKFKGGQITSSSGNLKTEKPPERPDLNYNLSDFDSSHLKLKLSKFGTFTIRKKKLRIGRNPKTKEEKVISERNVALFKPAKEFKDFVNLIDD